MPSLGGICTARYFMRKERQRIDEMADRHRRRIRKKAHRAGTDAVGERLDAAEGDLGRMLLLALSVQRLLEQKQTLMPSEFTATAQRLDLFDGIADGKLDPAVVRSPDADRTGSMRPEDFLRDLESKGGGL